MQRWKLVIEYNGSRFSGWQRQKDAPSVQQTLEEAIFKFCQQHIIVHVAGRTDAGVHAQGQVVHFDLDYGDRPLEGFDLMKALNFHLRPNAVSVIAAYKADQAFHARFHAINKLYRYRIVQRPSFLTLDHGTAWHFKRPLDIKAMQNGAKHLLGHHDFTTFRDSQCQAKSPFKTLERLDITSRPYDNEGGLEIIIETEGRSFLHHQVRNMVGTLALVGEGKWQPDDIATALRARDRTAGGPTAPPDGLYLVRIDYPC